MNGLSLLGASHLDAVKALRSSPDRISITVCQGYDPDVVLRRRSEGEALASARAEKGEHGSQLCPGPLSMLVWIKVGCTVLAVWWLIIAFRCQLGMKSLSAFGMGRDEIIAFLATLNH